MVQFEEGAEFDEENWDRHGYIGANEANASVNIELLENGDVIFPVGAKMLSCCQILGLDVQRVFPSCPQIMQGLIVVRGTWDADAGHYHLSYSRPVVISDLVSSRGVGESSWCSADRTRSCQPGTPALRRAHRPTSGLPSPMTADRRLPIRYPGTTITARCSTHRRRSPVSCAAR